MTSKTSKSKEIYHGTALNAESSDSDEDVFVTGSQFSENILTGNNRTPSSPKRKKRSTHVILSDDEDSETRNHVDCHIQTATVTGNETSDINIGIENNMTSSWSERLRKRRSTTSITISSDDEEESLDNDTPGTLRNRNRTSATKVQRALHLEQLKEKRKTSLDRKSSRSLSFEEQPSHLVDQEGPSSPEVPGNDVPDYSSSDDFEENFSFGESDQRELDDDLKAYEVLRESAKREQLVTKRKVLRTTGRRKKLSPAPLRAPKKREASGIEAESSKEDSSDDDSDEGTDLIGFIVTDSSQSQENNDHAGGPVVKDGDFIALRDLNENNIHELYKLVKSGTQLNWYMRLTNRRSFIATAQFVPVTDVNLDDYIGPITVQHCPSVKEHSVVEVEEELADVCKALITESCGKALKLESAKKPKHAVTAGTIHRKPCRKQAHAIYVQIILSSALDSEFLDCLEENTEPYFDEAIKVIREALDIRIVNLVESSVWDVRFKNMLINCRFLRNKPLPKARKAKCEACGRHRHITRSFVFYEAGSDGKKIPMKKFAIGCDCAKRGTMYRKLVRYDSRLRQSCIKKVNLVKAKGILSVDHDVVKDCINNEKWLKMRFEAFEALLDEADGYAKEGKEHKRLKAKYNKEVEWL